MNVCRKLHISLFYQQRFNNSHKLWPITAVAKKETKKQKISTHRQVADKDVQKVKRLVFWIYCVSLTLCVSIILWFNIYFYSPIMMSLAVWKSCSSSQVGCSAFRMSQTLLCSRSHMVAYMVRPGRMPNTSWPMARRLSAGMFSGYTMCTGTSDTVGGYTSPFTSCGWKKS